MNETGAAFPDALSSSFPDFERVLLSSLHRLFPCCYLKEETVLLQQCWSTHSAVQLHPCGLSSVLSRLTSCPFLLIQSGSQSTCCLSLSSFLSFSVCVGFFVNVPGVAWFLLLFFAHQPSTIWLSHHFSNDDNEHGGRETRQTHTQSPSPLYYNYYYVSLLIVLLFVVCERGKLREKLRESSVRCWHLSAWTLAHFGIWLCLV